MPLRIAEWQSGWSEAGCGISTVTQTLVQHHGLDVSVTLKAIGPWYDRGKAELYRQTRSWTILEKPGRGYQRAVSSRPPIEILEIQGLKLVVDSGSVVIAAGGRGIPVIWNAQGNLEGIEADTKFTLSRLAVDFLLLEDRLKNDFI